MGWLIALGILVLLSIIPLGASLRYDEGGFAARVIAGPVRVTVFPQKKEKPKKEKKEKESAPDAQKKAAPEKKSGSGGSVKDFLPLVRVGLDLLGAFRRKLRVKDLELKVILAGDDPCDLAVNYGNAWAALGNLMPRLERYFVIRKRDLEIECDFTADETRITARMDLTITLGRLVALAAVYGVRGLREFLKIKNKRKGGAVK